VDGYAVVVVAAPPAGELERATPRDDRAGRRGLDVDLTVDAGTIPVVEPAEVTAAAAAELLTGFVVRPCDEAVERHRHVQPDGSSVGHGISSEMDASCCKD
jgi:hypothetical protein